MSGQGGPKGQPKNKGRGGDQSGGGPNRQQQQQQQRHSRPQQQQGQKANPPAQSGQSIHQRPQPPQQGAKAGQSAQQQPPRPQQAWGNKQQPQKQAQAGQERQHQQPAQSQQAWGSGQQSQQLQQASGHRPAQSNEPKQVMQQEPLKKEVQQSKPSKLSKSSVSMFPSKPQRSIRPPGNPVQLITNLFKISVKTNKPIYRHGVTVEAVESSETASNKGPRKLSKEIRLPAVREAIRLWVSNNNVDKSVKNLNYSYVLDSNGSVVFALFNMLAGIAGQEDGKKCLVVNVEIPVDTIIERKVQIVKKRFLVQLSDGARLNVPDLLDYCAGKGTKDYSSLHEHIRALNTILHGQIVTIPALVVSQNKSGIGSVFPFLNQEQFEISPGVFCNKGTTLSVRATESGLALNVANTVAPFYQPLKMTDYILKRYPRHDLSRGLLPYQIDSLKRELKNKQVQVLHINYGTQQKPHYKKYRVHDIKGTGQDKFKSRDAQGREFETTVEAYFAKEYPAHKLKYPKLPCIVDNGRQLPLEVCQIVEKQRVARRLDPQETSNVIREAALKPERHFDQVMKNVNSVSKSIQPFSDFGLELDCKPIEVEGRELPPIKLKCGGNRPVMANNGQYNIQRDRFCMPTKINKWCMCILIDNNVARDGPSLTKDAQKFASLYCDAARSKGVNIAPMSEVNFIPRQPPTTLNTVEEPKIKAELRNYFIELNEKKMDFAIILLPDRIDWLYGYIQYLETLPDVRKRRGPSEKCTRTSCIRYDNYKKKIIYDRSNGIMFLSNLWLKHNVKLGGANVVLDADQNFGIAGKGVNFLGDDWLFISIDVCHPAPGDKFMQSVAAMVGMWDLTNLNISHSTRLRVQAKQRSKNDLSTVEEVGEAALMFEDILQTYIKRKGKEPKCVVVLRDGVSEGQFKMVLEFELSKIKAVLSRRAKAAKLACLTVQKRHRTRFIRKNPVETPKGKDYNIQPGTVVDSKVTHPNDFTFYLAPHKAIQGTAKAPYIYMIYDDIGFDLDSAQAMIHALSYLSPRCTKGTSIPTPINLADLAAERGKNIVIAWASHLITDPKKVNQDELLAKLNAHLSNLGEDKYKDTLYYV